MYRARDTRLGRQVAIKVLPEAVAADAERLARFEREAKLLASLNHPNIATIHGFEDSDGVKALVLELVEGPTLAERIQRGPIPVEEAMPIAKQIAQALEAGHEAGIVHRDLKPANVKLKEDGMVKVLDYGLAKALEGDRPATSDPELSQSPTLTRQGTQVGVILGTATYMSPEQAKGNRVDRRADVWGFGAVLYEMLTGKRAFAGDELSDTLAAVLRAEPDYGALPAGTPVAVRRALELCLAKDARLRIRDIGDARLAIDGAFQTQTPSASAPGTRLSWPWAVAALGVLAGVAGLLRGPEETERGAPMRFTIGLPRPATVQISVQQMTGIALSPDGRRLAFVAGGLEDRMLYLRDLNAFEARPLPGSEDAMSPFFSPDGSWWGS